MTVESDPFPLPFLPPNWWCGSRSESNALEFPNSILERTRESQSWRNFRSYFVQPMCLCWWVWAPPARCGWLETPLPRARGADPEAPLVPLRSCPDDVEVSKTAPSSSSKMDSSLPSGRREDSSSSFSLITLSGIELYGRVWLVAIMFCSFLTTYDATCNTLKILIPPKWAWECGPLPWAWCA